MARCNFYRRSYLFSKKIAKKLPDLSSNNVVLVIGDDTVLNETLNGLLAVKRKYELPIAYIPINADTNFSNKLNIKTTQSALHHLQYITHPTFLAISKITGDIPKRQTKYFVNSLGIGFDVALTTHQNNKIIHQKKSVFHSIKNYFAIATAFCNQKNSLLQ
ncbi:hypothetical protein [Leuconostoc litchii]|uniref:hypothetical protein n=1 Tax=Leuconostoc litchii TaxID=1981069 RepID=UPI0024E17905|nr:hypothetical protein [Leuconostoc litchii]